MRSKSFACSKFADIIRGNPRPQIATWEEYDKWVKDNQANSLHEEDFKLWHSLIIWIEGRVYSSIDL